MHKLAIAFVMFANSALAHEGHGAPMVHLHWWEYSIVAAVVAGVVTYVMRK
jgi:hypothetical protein